MSNILWLLRVHCNTSSINIISSWALMDYKFWCSLNVNSNYIVSVGMSNCSDWSFSNCWEWNIGFNLSELLCNYLMYWYLSILQEVNQTNFSSLTNGNIECLIIHFNSGICIIHYWFLNQFNNIWEQFTIEEGVLSCISD